MGFVAMNISGLNIERSLIMSLTNQTNSYEKLKNLCAAQLKEAEYNVKRAEEQLLKAKTERDRIEKAYQEMCEWLNPKNPHC